MIETKEKNFNNIKVIRKAFKKYTKTQKDFFKQHYTLVIHDLYKTLKLDSYAAYDEQFEKLTAEERVICFHGVLIRLSKKEFAVIRLLIQESFLSNNDYNEILIRKKTLKAKSSTNLKSFVCKLKKKIFTKVKEHQKKNACSFPYSNDKEINKLINELVYYREYQNGYAMYSNFKYKRPPRTHKQ